jgi:hypothetical protein
LTSYLTGLESAAWQLSIFVFICKIDWSKPVKQEVNGTVILPSLVFPVMLYSTYVCVYLFVNVCMYYEMHIYVSKKSLHSLFPVDILYRVIQHVATCTIKLFTEIINSGSRSLPEWSILPSNIRPDVVTKTYNFKTMNWGSLSDKIHWKIAWSHWR